MKLRSAPLDDVHNELLFLLDEDGGGYARVVRRLVDVFYRAHHALLLAWLRLPWHPYSRRQGGETC